MKLRLMGLACLTLMMAAGCSSDGGEGGGGGSAGAGGSGGESGAGGGSEPSLSFFVTSIGSGASGGNLGGLAGADEICTTLATAVGAGGRVWRAYLSTSAEDARDRIGTGPWYNAARLRRLRDLSPLRLQSEGVEDVTMLV